jgi:hypothetical protein
MMRKRFDRSSEIDAASNLRVMTMMQNHDEPYSEGEELVLRNGLAQITKFEAQKGKELKLASKSTMAKLAYDRGQSIAFGWASTSVRTSVPDILAFLWDGSSRANA